MKPKTPSSVISRRGLLASTAVLTSLPAVLAATAADAQSPAGVLASWNDGPAKQAMLDFVRATTDRSSRGFRTRRKITSPPTTRTAPCRSSIRFTPKPCLQSTAYVRWRPEASRMEEPRNRSRRCSPTILQVARAFRRAGLGGDYLCDPCRCEPQTAFLEDRPGNGWRRRSIRASNGPTPNWSISR